MKKSYWLLLFCLYSLTGKTQQLYKEPYRPQIHFSPRAHWINDPNGMVYYKGIYHLFFQYYPDATVWGPMHWGHATSKDLIHWQEQPIALYPDSLGYIFSGSAVADSNNTSGLGGLGATPAKTASGQNPAKAIPANTLLGPAPAATAPAAKALSGKAPAANASPAQAGAATPPLVAIFTHHDPNGEQAHRNDFQNQSLAYSLDGGKTWTKYANNPVLKNPGITDFRDPKVIWYAPASQWIMTLAVKDHISFYSSKNLKDWTKESDFGADLGAHGGVWECPDLFPLDDNGKNVWVLIVNINPGGPNKGSATQYFLGRFDGHHFVPDDEKTRWLDYGPDEYAGVTWSNTPGRHIFLGWMSNWLYANQVPTVKWRNAMTIPRELTIKHTGKERLVASEPVKELSLLASKKPTTPGAKAAAVTSSIAHPSGATTSSPTTASAKAAGPLQLPCRLTLHQQKTTDLSITFSNNNKEQLIVGYDQQRDQYYIDRTRSGDTSFNKEFAGRHWAPRLTDKKDITLELITDISSIELFADGGTTVMTELFFPTTPYDQYHLETKESVKISYTPLTGIWP